ncbi:MAG: lipid-A-disaccharide synthase [Thermoanaerobaculales bacterium]
MSDPTLMIVAGEVSGDIHAGNMLRELQVVCPDVQAFGVGGERLAANGLTAVASSEELSHMGLVEVVRELPRIRRLMRRLVGEARKRRPALAVLVDSPDFNLRLATHLRKLGIPVVLFVSPQLWAWRRWRVRKVRRLSREVLCILPFEVPFYQKQGVPARYVGHPLVDEIARADLLDQQRMPRDRKLGLLPGSRAMEVRQLLPVMLEAARKLSPETFDELILVEAPGMEGEVDKVLDAAVSDSRLRRVRGEGRRRDLLTCTMAWTASGTATLECALLGVPMVVGYRLQSLSYALARILVRVPHVALVNLISGSRVVPELLQADWEPGSLASVTRRLLDHGIDAQRDALEVVRERLGGPGASRRAAEAIAEHLPSPNGRIPRLEVRWAERRTKSP